VVSDFKKLLFCLENKQMQAEKDARIPITGARL